MFQASSTAHLDCHFFLFSNFLRIFFNCRTSIQSPVFDQIAGRLGDKGIPPIFITKLIPTIDHRTTGRRHRSQGAVITQNRIPVTPVDSGRMCRPDLARHDIAVLSVTDIEVRMALTVPMRHEVFIPSYSP